MASLKPNGKRWRLVYDRKRRTINFPVMPEREAKKAKRHIEHLIECERDKLPCDKFTREWLTQISAEFHKRIADKGLCEYRFDQQTRTIAGLCEHYIEWKKQEVEPATITDYQKTVRMMLHYFKPGRDIATISPGDMDDFIRWIYKSGKLVNDEFKEPLGKTTASRRCQAVKSIFHRAKRRAWITPTAYYDMFDAMPKKTRTNPKRRHWVEAKDVQLAMKHALNNEQRLIFALGRWGGLRIPSELLRLVWSDVDWEQEKILIRAPKQKNNEEKIERLIPIWPEIRPYLEAAFPYDAVERTKRHIGHEHVIKQYRSPNTSAHARLLKWACYRAGMTDSPKALPWPKLWLNMRSTRVTELKTKFPDEYVDYVMNHSATVSKIHYQQWETFEWRT